MTDTNGISIAIAASIGAVKFTVTRGDKQLCDTELPIATACDIGGSLIRASAQTEVIKLLLKEADACGMRDRLENFSQRVWKGGLRRRRQMTSGDLAGVLIDHSIGRVKIEFINLDERGLSFEVNMPVVDARKFSAGLIKAIDSAEKLQDGQDDEVKNSVRSALKKIVEKIKKTDPE